MKLLTKLTLLITLSKLLIVVLFVLLLPLLVSKVSSEYTNYSLGQQKKKVLAIIEKNGFDSYLQGDSAYGSYTMLKEEYISLVPMGSIPIPDTIITTQRIIEDDTLNYRVLTHQLKNGNQNYLLEIGKTTSAIGQYNSLLQHFTLYVLVGLIAISIFVDLLFTNLLLRPLAKIVKTKIIDRKFPFKESLSPVKTSTADFKYLDESLIELMETIHEAFEKEREFTSNASHELMTPISILQTNIENLMVEEGITEEQQEKISAMMKTLNRLKKIVHSLLYISRIENDQFSKNDVVNTQSLVKEVMEELSHRLELKSIQFHNHITAGVSIQQVNHDLVFQLLYNLINNAIRYNKEGGSITVKDELLPGKAYHISITDTGIGIKEAELAAVFNRFKKSNQSTGEGYGLGLSIVKSIATYHGFSIDVKSVFGKSASFTIQAPANMLVST